VNPEVQKLIEDFKRKIFRNIYLVFGEEEYYHDYLEKQLTEHALEESEKDFNLQIVYARDVSFETTLNFTREINMWGGRKVVVVREAQDWKEWKAGEGSTKVKKGGMLSPAQLLEKPFGENILFLSYKHGSPDKRSAFFKAIQKHGVLFESKKIYDNKVPDWIKEYVRMHKRNIQPMAASLLAEHVGNDLNRIHLELQKIFITVPEGAEINTKDVNDKAGIHKEYNIFELQQSLSRRNAARALKIAQYFGKNEKDHPMVMIVSALFGYFTKVLKVHYLQDKSKTGIASALGINPYFAEEYLEAAGHYSTRQLKKIFSILKEYDLKSKGVDNVSFKPSDLLQEMVIKILN
jgi:DNA polymerase-3 subunit delta